MQKLCLRLLKNGTLSITHSAFLDYRVGAVHVSAKGKVVIQKLAKGEKVSHDVSGLAKENGMNL